MDSHKHSFMIGCLWIVEVGAVLALLAFSFQAHPKPKAVSPESSDLQLTKLILASDAVSLQMPRYPGRGLPGRREGGGSRHT